MKQKEVEIADIVKLWKDKKVVMVTMNFSCGGDSMNDTDFIVELEDGTEETDGELVDYFDNAVYQHVEFYENSDGHYEGEAGTVEITLDEDDDEFFYSKSSTSQWNESDSIDVYIPLTSKESAFIKAHVDNIYGGEDIHTTINYKHDFILTTPMEKLVKKLETRLDEKINNERISLDVENLNDWYTFTTNEEGELEIEDNKLTVHLNYSYTEYKDGD